MDLEALAASWKARFADDARRADERAEALRAGARKAARVLTDEFGATEVWLFGSLAWGHPHGASDVDLAARGVPPARFFEALARVCDVVGGDVDLVPLETCEASLRQRVVERGVRLDGR